MSAPFSWRSNCLATSKCDSQHESRIQARPQIRVHSARPWTRIEPLDRFSALLKLCALASTKLISM